MWCGSRILALDLTESVGNVKSGPSISGRAECGSVVPGLYTYNLRDTHLKGLRQSGHLNLLAQKRLRHLMASIDMLRETAPIENKI